MLSTHAQSCTRRKKHSEHEHVELYQLNRVHKILPRALLQLNSCFVNVAAARAISSSCCSAALQHEQLARTARLRIIAMVSTIMVWVMVVLLLCCNLPNHQGVAAVPYSQTDKPVTALQQQKQQHRKHYAAGLGISAAETGTVHNVRGAQHQHATLQHTVHAAAVTAADGSAQKPRLLQQQQQQQQGGQHAAAQQQAATQAQPGAAPLPKGFTIPQPAPGTSIPAEPLVPLYSPDQLRLRHPILDDVPLDRQVISLMEQMQQAAHLNRTLTPQQLYMATPLLGRHGVLKVAERTEPSQYPDGYIAICAIVKNQHKDVREWIEYHKWIGVNKIYIYDNNSTVPLSTEISDFMQTGFVEYAFFVGQERYRDLFRTSSQWWAYNDCVTRYRHRHRWIAFIDADEFIVLHNGSGTQNITEFMKGYDQYGGLAINWMVFGSSHHKQRPEGGVLVNYWQCLPPQQEQNQHVKMIANTAHLMTIGDDPHRVYYRNMKKYYTVNELGQRVQGPKSPPSHTKIALYHYLTKSESEYMQKMQRGSAAGNYKSPEFFTAINDLATANCTRAISLGIKCCPSVRNELGPKGIARVKAAIAVDEARHAPLQPAGNTVAGGGHQ